MNISKMFIKSKLFFLKNTYLIIISAFLTTPISIFTCVALYSLIEEAYSFRNLFFGVTVAYILLIWIVWFILKTFSKSTSLKAIKKHWGIWFFILAVFAFLGWYIFGSDFYALKLPNYRYEVKISPAEDSSGSICIRDLKNNQGHINEYNDSIFDLEITGEWKNNTNGCQFFIGKSKTGVIEFKNIGPLDDELVFVLLAYPKAGELLIRTNTSHEIVIDSYDAIENHRLQIVELAPNYTIDLLKTIILAGSLSLIFVFIFMIKI